MDSITHAGPPAPPADSPDEEPQLRARLAQAICDRDRYRTANRALEELLATADRDHAELVRHDALLGRQCHDGKRRCAALQTDLDTAEERITVLEADKAATIGRDREQGRARARLAEYKEPDVASEPGAAPPQTTGRATQTQATEHLDSGTATDLSMSGIDRAVQDARDERDAANARNEKVRKSLEAQITVLNDACAAQAADLEAFDLDIAAARPEPPSRLRRVVMGAGVGIGIGLLAAAVAPTVGTWFGATLVFGAGQTGGIACLGAAAGALGNLLRGPPSNPEYDRLVETRETLAREHGRIEDLLSELENALSYLNNA